MKKRILIILYMIVLSAFFCLTTCEGFHNEIISTWWQNDEDDLDYVAIIKDVPLLVYETIVEEKIIYETIYEIIEKTVIEYYPEYIYIPGETIYIEKPLPPEVLMQHINIEDIQFIIFAGESIEFNGEPGHFDAAGIWVNGNTKLSSQEIKTNISIVDYLAEQLHTNQNYFLILHGHANPVDNIKEANDELNFISYSRASSVQDAVSYTYFNDTEVPHPIPPMEDPNKELTGRMTAKGYGGGRNLSGPSSTYAGLNRRVEAILFTVETEKVNSDTQR